MQTPETITSEDDMAKQSGEWQPIESAPFRKVIEVRNPQMEKPVLATRGYADENGVHPDLTFCTSVYTPDDMFPTRAGMLVCASEWRPAPTPQEATR